MKKIFVLLSCLLLMTGCKFEEAGYTTSHNNGEITVKNVTRSESYQYSIEEIEYRGEKHEYIVYAGGYTYGLSHWEGCRYCKYK